MAAVERTGPRRFSFRKTPLAVIIALVASLGGIGSEHEGRRFRPYRDGTGEWTVCAGITGQQVVPGRRYTEADCRALEEAYVHRMLKAMGQCVDGEFTVDEVKAWGHFAYNIGTDAFCRSTAARRLNAGERETACKEISRFVYANGRDCRKPSSNCLGIVQRRVWERALCEGRN